MAENGPEKKAHSQSSQRQGFFYQIQIVVGAAFVLATLFTLWTPGVSFDTNQPQGLSFGPPPDLISEESSVAQSESDEEIRIGIVAGHWGNDSGAVCSDGLTEAEVNLEIASLVQKFLADRGYKVDLLKEFDLDLTGYHASALVSIHADSCEYINELATGFKVAQAMGAQRPEKSARLTACLRDRYQKITDLEVHSTSVTDDMTSYHAFSEIHANTPAAIIETGFLNLDRQFLTEQPETVAEAIAAGIVCFIENESTSSSQGFVDQ
jgi:N-acetylmuramoyl-L-alanine amidase